MATHDASGFTSGLLIGLIMGAAAVHYLENTEEGKDVLAALKDRAADALKDVKENPALADKIRELEATMNVARETINQAAEKVVEATEEPAKPAAKKKNLFQKMGVTLKK
jgi:hypothetical protein